MLSAALSVKHRETKNASTQQRSRYNPRADAPSEIGPVKSFVRCAADYLMTMLEKQMMKFSAFKSQVGLQVRTAPLHFLKYQFLHLLRDSDLANP